MKLRLGTRGSDLARTQATTVAQDLAAAGYETELKIIRTAGDRSTAASFGSIGPQGVFVREIEQALLEDEIDLAVHSFKDLPTRSPAALVVAAVPERADPADLLLVRAGRTADPDDALLPVATGARIGTASARRRVWIEHFRPDLAVESLRGNVPTRIKRLADGGYDAIMLAAAGVARLREETDVLEALLADLDVVRLDPLRFVPAPAQGALAIQCRRDDETVMAALAALDHPATRAAVTAERDLLTCAEGGCDIAFGAHCRRNGDGLELVAMLERAGRVRSARAAGTDASTLVEQAWQDLLAHE